MILRDMGIAVKHNEVTFKLDRYQFDPLFLDYYLSVETLLVR